MQEQTLRYHGILRRMNNRERVELIDNLVEGQADDDQIQILTDLLDDDSYELRVAAYRKLASIGYPALQTIGRLALEGTTDQRFWCVKLLLHASHLGLKELEKCVREEDPVILSLVIDGLGQQRAESSVSLLMSLLTSGSWQVRQQAFEALKKYGEGLYPRLESWIQTENEDMFFWSVRLLGAMGHKSHGLLHRLLREADAEKRFLIAGALGESGDVRVIRLLVQSLGEKPVLISRRASAALVQIGEASIRPLLEALRDVDAGKVRWYLETLCALGESGQDELALWLQEQSELWLWDAREEFLCLGRKLPLLLKRLCRMERRQLRFFAYSLVLEKEHEASEEEILDLAVQGLRDAHWPIRKMCADWLGERSERVVQRLLSRMTSAGDDEFFWMVEIFSRSHFGRVELARNLDPSERLRSSSIARALSQNVPCEAIDPLVQCLRSEHWVVRKACADTLIQAGKKSVSRVVQALISPHEEQVFWLGRVLKGYGREVWPHLLALLHEPQFPGWLAAKAIGMIALPYFLPGLIEALKEEDPLLVLHACYACHCIDSERFMPASLGLLSQLDVREHPELMELMDVAEPETRDEHLLSGLKSANEQWVLNSAVLIARYGLMEGKEDLLGFLKRGEYTVRAALTLAELGVQEAAPWLRKALAAESRMESRLIYLKALCQLSGDEPVQTMLRAGLEVQDERRRALLDSEILRMGLNAVRELGGLLGHSDPAMRGEAARILRQFGPLSIPVLKGLVQDSSDSRRLFATKLLKEIRGDEP